jgi:hypothetical protein
LQKSDISISINYLTYFIKAMTLTDSLLTEKLTDLVTQTATLKSLVAGVGVASPQENRPRDLLTETCNGIEAAAVALAALGPVSPLPEGLYRAWLELVLLLGEAKKGGFRGETIEALDRAIESVRTLRRAFGIAPGGA